MKSIRCSRMHQSWRYCLWLIALAMPLIWWSLPGAAASTLFTPVWIAVTQLIFAGSLEAAKLQRRAWLGQYLKATSPWHLWLSGGVVMVIWHQLLGAAMALVLLVSLRRLAATDWLLLLLALGLFIVYRSWLQNRLEKHVITDYLAAVTRRLAVPPVAVLLTLGLALSALWRPQPYMVSIPWEVALRDYLVTGSGQTLLGALERLASALELTGFWAMQNALNNLDVSSSVAILGWGLLLLMQGVLSWSFIRLLAGIDALHDRFSARVKHDQPIEGQNQNTEGA